MRHYDFDSISVALMTRLIIPLILLVSFSPNLLAWGKTGHRVTGAIAAPFLSDDAKAAITDILGVETLAEASTWADFMRASPEPFWQQQSNPYHYVTVPVGQHYSDGDAPPQGDAVTALQQFAETLQSPDATKVDKQLALRFSVHLIGDLHQPLHTGNGTDRGGNDFLVTFFGEVSNLHSVWDSKLIDHDQLSYTELTAWLLPRITVELANQWNEPDPIVWITESAALRDTIYPERRDLSWDYVFEQRQNMRTRLMQGGVRMAAYFNALFAAP